MQMVNCSDDVGTFRGSDVFFGNNTVISYENLVRHISHKQSLPRLPN